MVTSVRAAITTFEVTCSLGVAGWSGPRQDVGVGRLFEVFLRTRGEALDELGNLMAMSSVARLELEAVFQDGVFRPLTAPEIAEGSHVHLLIEAAPTPADAVELAGRVYDGLTPEEIDEIEALALDRAHFLGPRSAS